MNHSITDMIREEHAQVAGAFHEYQADASPDAKQKLLNTVGRVLENQARIKDELFYPALRALDADEATLTRSEAAHHQMHSLIGQLRDMRPTATRYDDTVQTLKEVFIRHMVDEEASLLPQAERLLQDQLRRLGVRMQARRLLMKRPTRSQVGLALLAMGGVALGAYLGKRAFDRRA